MLRTVAIAGYRKRGKTEIIERLIECLVERGYRVGTVKHIPRKGFTIDRPKTDTWRHSQAGSSIVVSISPDEVAILKNERANLNEVLLTLENLDFVIVEGYRGSENIPKIMVTRNEDEAMELDDEFTIGFIGYGIKGKPTFDKGDVEGPIRLIEQNALPPVGNLDCGDCGYGTCSEFILAALKGEAPMDGCRALHGSVDLVVDGKRVPIKYFVQKMIAKTLWGMVSSLKGGAGRKIEIEVRQGEG